jgi:transketolase
MMEVGQEDPDLVVLVGDISHFVLQPFAQACPGRYFNVGICEPTMLSMAAGLARSGFYPVVHTISPFIIERSFEQIKLDFCYQKLGGNLVTVGSAFDYSNLGSTHHCYGDFALMKTLDGAQITYPSTALEFDTLFRQVYQSGKITLYRVPGTQHSQEFLRSDIQFGKAIKVVEGRNLTIVATGPQLDSAIGARDVLAGKGWDVEIIYVHTIRPLDGELVRASISKTRNVLTIEEHSRSGGLGDEILRATVDIPDVRYSFKAIPDQFITGYGTYHDHCESLGLTPEGIVQAVDVDFGPQGPAVD